MFSGNKRVRKKVELEMFWHLPRNAFIWFFAIPAILPFQGVLAVWPECKEDRDAVKLDVYGDALPAGAFSRLGTSRYRLRADGYHGLLIIDGEFFTAASANDPYSTHDRHA